VSTIVKWPGVSLTFTLLRVSQAVRMQWSKFVRSCNLLRVNKQYLSNGNHPV